MTDNEWGAQEMYLQVMNDFYLYHEYVRLVVRIRNMICKTWAPGATEGVVRELTRDEKINAIHRQLVLDLGFYETSKKPKPEPRIVLMEGMGKGREAIHMAAERLWDDLQEDADIALEEERKLLSSED